MTHQRTASGMIAAERRRRIYESALRRGSVSVSELAASLGVAQNTVRYDLDILAREGKLVRSHGGATVKQAGLPVPPYSQIRDANMLQKSWIAAAGAEFLPETGCVFINAGSTTYQLVLRIQERHGIAVTTNSPEIALHLALNGPVEVGLIGGEVVKDSLETDGSLSADMLARVYWDTAFMGLSAIDPDHGITSINLPIATLESQVMEHSRQVIGLCDSSKLGRFSRVKVGPVSLIDVLITDNGAKQSIVESIESQGVQVIVAGPDSGLLA